MWMTLFILARRAMLLGFLVLGVFGQTAWGTETPPVNGRFILTDVNGLNVSDETYKGKVRVMSFGYTFCPDICPTTLATMSEAAQRLGQDRDKVVLLFVSVDPERDTLPHLKEYLTSFPGIRGLTGTPAMVAAAARNFRVIYERQPAPKDDPSSYGIDHSTGIYIMSREGRFLSKLPHVAAPEDVAARIRSYLKP